MVPMTGRSHLAMALLGCAACSPVAQSGARHTTPQVADCPNGRTVRVENPTGRSMDIYTRTENGNLMVIGVVERGRRESFTLPPTSTGRVWPALTPPAYGSTGDVRFVRIDVRCTI